MHSPSVRLISLSQIFPFFADRIDKSFQIGAENYSLFFFTFDLIKNGKIINAGAKCAFHTKKSYNDET